MRNNPEKPKITKEENNVSPVTSDNIPQQKLRNLHIINLQKKEYNLSLAKDN